MLNNNLFDVLGIDEINSATKYPSILTYHELGSRGEHIEVLTEGVTFEGLECELTEKIDGLNMRIILYGDDYLIGSREDIIYAKGDRLINVTSPTNAIIKHVKIFADKLNNLWKPNEVVVIFGEVYGGKVTDKSKNYTRQVGVLGFRVFDIAQFLIKDIFGKTVAQIASWRQHGGLEFVSSEQLTRDLDWFNQNGIKIERVPVLKVISGDTIPTTVAGVKEFLKEFIMTVVGLTSDAQGWSEGIVVRSKDRSLIRKLRFYSYNKS